MLAVLFPVGLFLVFTVSPDISYFEKLIEAELKKGLDAEQVDISTIRMYWEGGPIIDMGFVNVQAEKLSIQNSHIIFSYPIYHLFQASLSPELKVIGGRLHLNLDVERQKKSEPINIITTLDNVQLTWVLQHEEQTFEHVYASIAPHASDILFKADGIHLSMVMDDAKPVLVKLQISNFSGFPQSWRSYVSNINKLDIYIQKQSDLSWSWSLETEGEQGLFAVDKVHLRIPFESLEAKGNIQFEQLDTLSLLLFEADKVAWRDGDNYANVKLKWSDKVIHLDASDGSVTMPMLWSWLWMLGGDQWHAWLNSMKHGRIRDVQASVDLDWPNPLEKAPTIQNLKDMKYRVQAKASDVDIALGLKEDYLYHIDGDVLVDEKHLEADVSRAVLNDDVGVISGGYQIFWKTLIMYVQAEGSVDTGRLHTWLDPDSAAELHWETAPTQATVDMEWNIHQTTPTTTIVHLQPTGDSWKLAPKGIPMVVKSGEAVWDFARGLDLKDMNVHLPWLDGQVSLFLNRHKSWALEDFSLNGYAPLAKLTEQFFLPIIDPDGTTTVAVNYGKGIWSGQLDLSKNDWSNFAGFDKQENQPLIVPFWGKPVSTSTLPIRIDKLESKTEGFSFLASLFIDEHKLDFKFKDMNTPAIRGDFRLLMPFDQKQAWGIEIDADFIDKPLLTRYLKEDESLGEGVARPWQIFATSKWVEWEESHAESVTLHFSSAEQSVGDFSVGYLLSGEADLENITARFSLNGKGKYDLHLLEAHGSGQKLQASGSVITQQDGSLKWQGMALMSGEFGTLMKQAEFDKLFQEGQTSALFLGQGEFKDGEPWWRKLKGNFRLRVDDGRIMEGGTLTHLLAAMNLLDLPKSIVARREDVTGEGLFYDKMQVESEFNENLLTINKLAFASSALDAGGKGRVDLDAGTLDLVLVVRPWQNIEAIIGFIPFVGYILTGEDKSFLRKVYHIHGPASDAVVDEVDPKDVGLPRSGLIEELFTLPTRWFGGS